jgi:hypothetical protein
MQSYRTATGYVYVARKALQDLVSPYRYDDNTLVLVLNIGLAEMSRIRPDIFLDLKYSRSLRKGDTGDGVPIGYTTADLSTNADGSYNPTQGTPIPVPSKYASALDWYMAGAAQFFDVTDTQDARAQGFLQKFQTHLTSLSAA